ncbi:B- and T-lymphocyte attenuator isoform X2 [Denticeps clupeoides]|uniref:B- and T-lymphocyte attenuator isoform X2 n=1 Tax=Denticeps clupeoides TaxID=299321 RepID=UPI0010A47E4D|nr:B- and T-lymphocyte attenuator isoform X2 [Denticeps clupeoides]
MRLCGLQTVLHLLTLFQVFLSGRANDLCIPEFMVRRNSRSEASLMDNVIIKCPITYCDAEPIILWCKVTAGNDCNRFNSTSPSDIRWENTGEKTGTSVLQITNVTMKDSGLYRCKIMSGGIHLTSHSITVTVADISEGLPDQPDSPLPYIYVCCIVAGAVILVIVLTFIILRRKGGSKRRRRNRKNSATEIARLQMSNLVSATPDLHGHHTSRQNSELSKSSVPPPSIYENAPQRRTSQTNRVSGGGGLPPNRHSGKRVAAPSGETEHYDNKCNLEEDSSPLVYASLNHQATPRGHAQPAQASEDFSEYAAIRVS